MRRFFFLAPLLLGGCSWLTPDYKRPAVVLPTTWNGVQSVTRDDSSWWQRYGDPVLDDLEADAQQHNDDIALAKSSLSQAQAQYSYAFANQLPSLSIAGTDAYGKFANGNIHAAGQSFRFPNKTSNFGFVGGMLNYELDLWGKNASLSDAARAGVQGAVYAKDAARLSVAASVAKLYFSLRALDRNVAILKDNVRTQDEILALVQHQYAVGVVDALLLQDATERRDAAHAVLPEMEDQRNNAESALSVLVGRSPQDIVQADIGRGRELDALNVPNAVPSLLPSELLERRPDIAMHEQMLIASNFNIGYARAAYFPSISLASLAGVNNIDIDNLYRATSRSWTLGAAMVAPVLDFGRTKSGVKLAKANKNQQVIGYQQSVRAAFKEVRDALLAQNTAAERDADTIARDGAAQQKLHLTQLRLNQGYASQIDVLAAQSTGQLAEIARVNGRLQRLDASVDLYRATGGGFSTNVRK